MGKIQKNEFFISGRVVFVGMPVFYTDKISKRIIVLEVWVDKYKNEVAFEFVNKQMDILQNIRKDDWVNIEFQLRGRSHTQADGKVRWYNSNEGLSCIKES